MAAARLTEVHRIAQMRISARVVSQMQQAWSMLDITAIDVTMGRWLDLASRIVQGQRGASAVLAGQYLQAFRALELGLRPTFDPDLARTLDVEALRTSLRVTGPIAAKVATSEGASLAEASRIALVGSASAASRHALGGGRDTIISSRDPSLLGVARVTSTNPCAFCAMLASRGPVYFSEESAGFRPHDACHCQPEPVYRDDAAWPPGSQRFREMYDQAAAGHSGKEAVNAFRRAYEAQL